MPCAQAIKTSEREKEVITNFCTIGDKIMREVYHCSEAADCICVDRKRHDLISFDYSDKILQFVYDAVNERIKQHKTGLL